MPPKKADPKKDVPKVEAKKVVPKKDDSSTAPDTAEDVKLSEKYKKVSQVEHVLLRPEMYVGSIENHVAHHWMFVDGAERRDGPVLLPPSQMDDRIESLGLGVFSGAEDGDGEEEDAGEDTKAEADDDEKEDEDDEAKKADAVDDVVGVVDGIDSRFLVPGKRTMAFQPGSLEVTKCFVNPGLLKIVDEILVNAADNRLVDSPSAQTYIRVEFDETTGRISVKNDGAAIPVVVHESGMYVPEMIFGSLLTSSHYDNDPNSIAAGRHGFGAKLTNIMSTEFSVDCAKSGKRFQCKWSSNMTEKGKRIITDTAGKDYTKITFTPDFRRFVEPDLIKAHQQKILKEKGIAVTVGATIPEDFNIIAELGRILRKRVLDLSASIGSVIKIYFNDVQLTPDSFDEYVRMHFPSTIRDRQPFFQHSQTGNHVSQYSVMAMPQSADEHHSHHQHVCLVNGVVTHLGGTHLRHLQAALDVAIANVEKKLKNFRVTFNSAAFKQKTVLFVNVVVPQPKFDSQSKDRLVSKHDFHKVDIKALSRHIMLLPFIRDFFSVTASNNTALEAAILQMKRTDNLMRLIPKLVEPGDMSTKRFRTLIITEGDSAKALALNSLSSQQRQEYGVIPIQGKLLNVRAATPAKIAKNKEIVHVLAALGLSVTKSYSATSELRYQRVMIMTDQDHDGMHIRGLIVSMLNYFWPGLLLKSPEYVSIFSTPLVKVRLPKAETRNFYSSADFKKWYNNTSEKDLKAAKIKYYKGLGTSTTEEGKEYFSNVEANTKYVRFEDGDSALLDKVFCQHEVSWRRQWLGKAEFTEDLVASEGKQLSIPNFIDSELVQFGMYNNMRMLPSVVDGLKTSQRKILWSIFQRDRESLRVSQLAGFVSERAMYHHGEASLVGTIVGMAQNFTGSNNVNYLIPDGQFGSRIGGGSDSAAPRYIFTSLAKITRKIFPAEDDSLLTYAESEGERAEPIHYVPIIPTLFLNGCLGIGMGFATNVERYLPESLIAATRHIVKGHSAEDAARLMQMGAVGFRGDVTPGENGVWDVSGAFEIYGLDDVKLTRRGLPQRLIIRITDIPYTYGTEWYRSYITRQLDSMLIHIADYSGANHVDLQLTVDTNAFLMKCHDFSPVSMSKLLGLQSRLHNRMVCIHSNAIKKFGDDPATVLDLFHKERLRMYELRLEKRRAALRAEIQRMHSHVNFADMIKKLGIKSILDLEEADIIALCKKHGVKEVDGSYRVFLNRPLSSFLKENTSAMREKLALTEKELKRSIAQDTAASVWLAELDELEKVVDDQVKVATGLISKELKRKVGGTVIPVAELRAAAVKMGWTPENKWKAVRKHKNLIKKRTMKRASKRKASDAAATASATAAAAQQAAAAVTQAPVATSLAPWALPNTAPAAVGAFVLKHRMAAANFSARALARVFFRALTI